MIEGPIQVNDTGLVFYFDAKEPKSYVGKPATNYLTTALTPNSATKESFVGSVTENSIIAPDGTLTAHKFQVTSGYVYQTLTIPVGTTITYSVWIKTLDVASTTSYGPYIWNYNSPTYGIVARDLSGVSFDWKRMSMTYTTLSHQSSFAISYAGTNGGMQGLYALWRPQLEYNSSATPFVNGTRSNTQGLLDLTGGSTIDLTNAGYNASSEITFNGSSNYITTPTINLGNAFTVSAWFNSSGVAGDTVIVGTDANGCDNWLGVSGGYLYGFVTQIADVNNFTFSGATALSNNQWYHGTIVANGNTVTLYLNGKQDYTTTTAFTIGAWNGVFSIGRRCPAVAQRFFNGKIETVSMYNRALSASEILKNFNSQRSRYSV